MGLWRNFVSCIARVQRLDLTLPICRYTDLERESRRTPRADPSERTVTSHSAGPSWASPEPSLRRLLEAVRPSAPANVVARLEGAIIVLDALAAGKPPSADDLLVPGPYTI